MKTNLQTFSFNSHALRVIIDDSGEPWFIAKDVADTLEYSDAQAMTRKLDEDEVKKANLQNVGLHNNQTLISESGLYSAILSSNKPEAKSFKRFITSEVLPTIRKTGSYNTNQGLDSHTLPSLLNPANKTMTVTEFQQWQASVKTTLNLVIKDSIASISIIASADDYLGLVMGKNTPDTNKLIKGVDSNEPRSATKETPQKRPKQRMWRAKEIEKLNAYYEDGLSYEDISEKLGRTVCSVNNAIMRHITKGGVK
ncbi:MAG: BRO family protein [Methylococcales bacterium]|nr:BRO family protein [Methylococcales bacterium]